VTAEVNTLEYAVWSRPTIMDGEVVGYAPEFVGEGKFPNGKEPKGFYHISASRNAAMVHKCEISSYKQSEEFQVALKAAVVQHHVLKQKSLF